MVGNFWQFRHCFPSLGSILTGQGFVQNGFSARERSHRAQAPCFLPLFRNSPAVTRGLHIPCPSSAKPWFPHLADLSRKCFINQLSTWGFRLLPSHVPVSVWSLPRVRSHPFALPLWVSGILSASRSPGSGDGTWIWGLSSGNYDLQGLVCWSVWREFSKINWKLSCEQH